MTIYTPDRYILIKLSSGDFKVLASWDGGYLEGDSWQLNSGIEKVTVCGTEVEFHGFSGSIYKVNKNSIGMNSMAKNVFANLKSLGCDRITFHEFAKEFTNITFGNTSLVDSKA